MEEAHPWVFIMITSLNVEKELCLKKQRENWFRRGSGSGSGHAEASLPRKSSGKLINANEERFALAA